MGPWSTFGEGPMQSTGPCWGTGLRVPSPLDLDDGDPLRVWRNWRRASYLCQQWDYENTAEHNPGRKLSRYNFFMLQADVLPNTTGFSSTRKRLVRSYECVPEERWNSLTFPL
jgi:hypothetical protein